MPIAPVPDSRRSSCYPVSRRIDRLRRSWSVRRLRLGSQPEPGFCIGIKGSLMPVSSVLSNVAKRTRGHDVVTCCAEKTDGVSSAHDYAMPSCTWVSPFVVQITRAGIREEGRCYRWRRAFPSSVAWIGRQGTGGQPAPRWLAWVAEMTV